MAKAMQMDFSNIKDAGKFSPKHKPEGDYRAKITKVEDHETKETKKPQWLFTITIGSATYPYYCGFEENVLWKIRNLAVAAGLSVPKKRIKLDPEKLVGKEIGVTLEDDEYDGKLKSVIAATFPTSELEGAENEDDDEDEGDDDAEEVDETPKKKKKDKKGKKKKVSDDELEEIDVDEI